MSGIQKLTKKQKKGLAFRERKSGRRHPQGLGGNNELDEMEANAVPAMEDQDIAGGYGDQAEGAGAKHEKAGTAGGDAQRDEGKRKEGAISSKGKGKAEAEDVRVSVPVLKKTGKRKREDRDEEEAGGEDEDAARQEKSSKHSVKRKKSSEEGKKDAKQRFLLFVGNLKYTTTREAIQKHFSACDPPPTIRLLTPKTAPGATQKAKSKGCAFLEFTHRNALQQALKLHQSELDGRMINVELTAGGGGKSDARLMKVREQNKALLGQRIERIEKEAEKDNSFPNLPQKPHRFSMTSGLEQKPSTKKTWTVGDIDDGETHRGGQKHRGKKKSKSKAWGTGVNAIPVG